MRATFLSICSRPARVTRLGPSPNSSSGGPSSGTFSFSLTKARLICLSRASLALSSHDRFTLEAATTATSSDNDQYEATVALSAIGISKAVLPIGLMAGHAEHQQYAAEHAQDYAPKTEALVGLASLPLAVEDRAKLFVANGVYHHLLGGRCWPVRGCRLTPTTHRNWAGATPPSLANPRWEVSRGPIMRQRCVGQPHNMLQRKSMF